MELESLPPMEAMDLRSYTDQDGTASLLHRHDSNSLFMSGEAGTGCVGVGTPALTVPPPAFAETVLTCTIATRAAQWKFSLG